MDLSLAETPPETLSHQEVTRIFEITLTTGQTASERFRACRDHTIYSIALMIGLRQHEIAALTVGDVFDAGSRAREYVALRVFKGCRRAPRSKLRSKARSEARSKRRGEQGKPARPAQTVFLPQALRVKLEAFWRMKHAANESLQPEAPLFVGRGGKPISTRTLRHWFHVWQRRAELPQAEPFNFHALRHTACTEVYRQHRDLKETQAFARHESPYTTSRYTHPTRAEVNSSIDSAAATWDVPSARRWPARR